VLFLQHFDFGLILPMFFALSLPTATMVIR
jgi:hypothetical protein